MVSQGSKKGKKILYGIIIAVFLLLLSNAFATKIIYDAIFVRYDPPAESIKTQPKELADMYTEHTFPSGENLLYGRLYSSGGDSLVVIAPGFRSSGEDYLWQIKSFLDFGRDVFIFDTTGSCHSEGESAVGFSQELFDLLSALDFIESQSYSYDDIFLFGHSRGGWAVCCALSQRDNISAAASVNGINSAMECVIAPVAGKIGPIAYTNYPFLWMYQSLIFDADTINLEASEQINSSDVPVLVVQAENDKTVPAKSFSIMAHKDEIESERAEFLMCDPQCENGHTALLFSEDGKANEPLMEIINDFFTSAENKTASVS